MRYTFNNCLQQMGVGKLWYFLYHYPRGMFKRSQERSLFLQFGDRLAKKKMEQAVSQLVPITAPRETFEVHFLTGTQYWYQTCFCAYSFMKQSNSSCTLVLYDDSSLKDFQRDEFRRIFPQCLIISCEEIQERLDRTLPNEKYPVLRARRLIYPHLRKLTDVHTGGGSWKLVLDSDMLFFKKPDFLLHWLRSPEFPCYMRDVETSYGYSKELLEELAGTTLPEKLNVGICGLCSDQIDWEQIEYWTRQLLRREGSHYTQEQALVALYCSNRKCLEADADEYIVLPSEQEVMFPSATLHHYVAQSKPWYFRHGWHNALKACQASE